LLPLVVFAALLSGLLPPHQMASHHAGPGSAGATHAEVTHTSHGPDDGHHAAGSAAASHHAVPSSDAGHEGHEHGPIPLCHASSGDIFLLPARCSLPDPSELFAVVAAVLAMGSALLVGPSVLLPRRSWRTRPWWRVSGIQLLTAVCVSRI
jgi:hypothetical protein